MIRHFFKALVIRVFREIRGFPLLVLDLSTGVMVLVPALFLWEQSREEIAAQPVVGRLGSRFPRFRCLQHIVN